MFSEILSNEKDSEFAISMVDLLNSILLTSTELFDLRNSLKDFNTPVIKTFIFCSTLFFNFYILPRKVSPYLFVYTKPGVIIQ